MTTTCTVCKHSISGNFCAHCGQQVTNKKASFFGLISDFFGNFFSLNKSFLGTSKMILRNPEYIVKNYHEGNRRYVISPGGFIIYGITLIAIHSIFYQSEIWGTEIGVGNFPLQYGLIIILLPFLTFASLLTFIRLRQPFIKHIISIAYNSTLFLIISIVLDDIMSFLYEDWFGNTSALLFLIFTFLWNSFVFSRKKSFGHHFINVLVQITVIFGVFTLLYQISS